MDGPNLRVADSSRIVKITKRGIPTKKSNITLEDAVFYRLGVEWKNKFLDWVDKQHKCMRCGALYNEIENIGSWKCKQHAFLDMNSFQDGRFYKRREWDCCGDKFPEEMTEIPRGCVASDHLEVGTEYAPNKDEVIVPLVMLPYVLQGGTKKQAILGHEDRTDYTALTQSVPNDYAIIRRFDFAEYTSRINRGLPAGDEVRTMGMWIPKKDLSWV